MSLFTFPLLNTLACDLFFLSRLVIQFETWHLLHSHAAFCCGSVKRLLFACSKSSICSDRVVNFLFAQASSTFFFVGMQSVTVVCRV